MKYLFITLASIFLYCTAQSQSITLTGKNIIYFNEEKKDTLYFTQQGKKFSKKQFVLIDGDNNFKLVLKNKNYKRFIKNKLVLTTNLFSNSNGTAGYWNTCTQTIDLAEALKLNKENDIIIHTDLYLYLGCHDFSIYFSENKKFFKEGHYNINNQGISDVYIASFGEGDHIYKGSVTVNFYDNLHDFYNKSLGYYEVYPDTKKIKISLSKDLKNEKIGIYKKVETPIEYTFSYEKIGDDFVIKP